MFRQVITISSISMSDEHFSWNFFICGLCRCLRDSLFAACVLGHSLGPFAYGVLRKFSG